MEDAAEEEEVKEVWVKVEGVEGKDVVIVAESVEEMDVGKNAVHWEKEETELVKVEVEEVTEH